MKNPKLSKVKLYYEEHRPNRARIKYPSTPLLPSIKRVLLGAQGTCVAAAHHLKVSPTVFKRAAAYFKCVIMGVRAKVRILGRSRNRHKFNLLVSLRLKRRFLLSKPRWSYIIIAFLLGLLLARPAQHVVPDTGVAAPQHPSYAQISPLDVQEQAKAEYISLTPNVAQSAPTVPTGNDYVYGNCTYGVASWTSVPTSLGNANQWAYNARAMGFTVTSTPKVGAVAQTGSGPLGHVALVESVSGNTVTVKEMNYAGLGIVDERTTPISEWQYIYF